VVVWRVARLVFDGEIRESIRRMTAVIEMSHRPVPARVFVAHA
jgi:hypothetical protein